MSSDYYGGIAGEIADIHDSRLGCGWTADLGWQCPVCSGCPECCECTRWRPLSSGGKVKGGGDE